MQVVEVQQAFPELMVAQVVVALVVVLAVLEVLVIQAQAVALEVQ